MPPIYSKLVTQDGNEVSSSNPLPVSATIQVGDVEIGAVEIKDGSTDTRAVVDATYGLAVDVKRQAALPAGTNVIGHVIVDSAGNVVVTSLPSLPAGTNVIGHVIVDSGSITADTELPAAAALADATANPTTPSIGSFAHGFNGTTWDRLRVDGNKNLIASLRNSSGVEPTIGGFGGDSLGTANKGVYVVSANELYNGSTMDIMRSNTQGALLASAARTATISSSDQTNYNAKGVHIYLNVSSAGTGSITIAIEEKDPVSGTYVALLTGAAVTTDGITVYKVYPGVTVAANAAVSDIIPRTWRVTVTHNNANSITYSVGYALNL